MLASSNYTSCRIEYFVLLQGARATRSAVYLGLNEHRKCERNAAREQKTTIMQEGEAAILKRQLQRRFGELHSTYAQRIAQADAQTLLHWGENILDAKTLDDVFNVSE